MKCQSLEKKFKERRRNFMRRKIARKSDCEVKFVRPTIGHLDKFVDGDFPKRRINVLYFFKVHVVKTQPLVLLIAQRHRR